MISEITGSHSAIRNLLFKSNHRETKMIQNESEISGLFFVCVKEVIHG